MNRRTSPIGVQGSWLVTAQERSSRYFVLVSLLRNDRENGCDAELVIRVELFV